MDTIKKAIVKIGCTVSEARAKREQGRYFPSDRLLLQRRTVEGVKTLQADREQGSSTHFSKWPSAPVAVLHGYQERNKAEYLRVSVICPIFADRRPADGIKRAVFVTDLLPVYQFGGLSL